MSIVRIPLYCRQGLGLVAIIDAEDEPLTRGYLWRAERGQSKSTWYAVANIEKGSRKTIKLHRLVMNAPDGVMVDHENHDGLDCRKSNLRTATPTQNQANRVKNPGATTSRFKGVSWNRETERWRARLTVSGKCLWIGAFSDEVEAALAYDKKAQELFGEYALLNFPVQLQREAGQLDLIR